MPFSHHSHSGQFCGHAKNTLEEVVQAAIGRKMRVFALTEHMPRADEDLYPEEIEGSLTAAHLEKLFDDYYFEALRLQKKYASQIKILVGVEIDWIRPSSHEYISNLLKKYQFELFIGSVHHVHEKPIDYDYNFYAVAREMSGGSDEKLYEAYFDLQYQMLELLKPPIVGHFDVIRLKADEPDGSLMHWPGVWHKISRNLDLVAGYGGILELNSAALRKGMAQPYPQQEICNLFLEKGGQFTLSDDSHGVDQVATNYDKLLQFVERTGIKEVVYLRQGSATTDARFPNISTDIVTLQDLKEIWARARALETSDGQATREKAIIK
ncbi:MAG: hypothetical protein Q9191_006725 [Dirinaria sp. TL-2023a]